MLHKPSVEEEEGAEGIREGLAKPEVHPIPSETIVLCFLHDGSSEGCAMCWWEISNAC